MKRAKRHLVLAVAMVTAFMMFAVDSTYAATFSPSLGAVKSGTANTTTRTITNNGYLNCQGIAFDVYTKKDGYSFNEGTDGNSGYQLVHFQINDGKIVKKGSLKYAKKNVGHANDAAIYKAGNGKKYMFVAISGGTEKSSKTFSGNTTKLGVIWMDEYNNKKAKLRGCKIKVKKGVKMSKALGKCAFSGVAYTGVRKVGKAKKPVFVFKDGRTFYAAYLTLSKSRSATFTIFDSARVYKPVIKYNGKKYEASTQGVTYHNGFLYLSYSGEKAKAINQNMLITRIKYGTLFKGEYKTVKKLQVKAYRIAKAKVNGTEMKLAKHIPEAIFFTTLNGKGNLYVSINRAKTTSTASDIDCVLRSSQKY